MKFIPILFAALAASASAEPIPLFRDPAAAPERRIENLLGRLSLEEKAALCHGEVAGSAEGRFESGGVPRLGIGPLGFRDGPQGVRTFDGSATTAPPCGLSLACTWDLDAAREVGRVLAEEMLAEKKQVLFGPGLNLMRDPRGGRNFEYFGEDPFLAGSIAAAYIRALQERGVGACGKHLVANDAENQRHFTSSNLDLRTLREMHFLPFEMAVRDGGAWSMMTANNLVNGVHVSANRPVVQALLKDRIGFDGVVLTDWRAAYDTVPTALAGTDMTTGLCAYVFGEGRLLAAVKSGQVTPAELDDKVRRILRLYLRTGLLDPDARAPGSIDTPEHRAAARRLAAEGMVLLKNDRALLPLDPAKIRNVLVTGPGADTVAAGRGSGEVHSAFRVTPLAGLRAVWGDRVKISHFPWPAPGSTRGRGAKAAPPDRREIAAGETEAARTADAVLFFARDVPHGEGNDLKDIDLPSGQAEAIAALAAVNPNVVVVLQTGEPVSLELFADRVPAILSGWYLGESAGDAIADVLTGKVAPGGKLAATFGRRLADYPCEALGLWPARPVPGLTTGDPGLTGKDRHAIHGFDADYSEGVFIGYRWFDERKIEPRFPFGHGLTYTTFEFSSPKVDAGGAAIRVTCLVRNIGKRAGAEVVQVYVAPPRASAVPRPPRELKGFAKVMLQPGESRQVRIELRPSALCYFDAPRQKWRADPGAYEIEIGASSRDIRLRSTVTLERERLVDWY